MIAQMRAASCRKRNQQLHVILFARQKWLSTLLYVWFVLFVQTTQADQNLHYEIVTTVPHDDSYFTQGLELSEGLIFESSGLYGKSKIRKYQPHNDTSLAEVPLPDQYFAEGLTVLEDELFVLTWKENTLLVLNPDDLSVVKDIHYEGEGWGLANNGKQLIMSNGSNTIYFRNPATFEIERDIEVYSQQHPVRRINELEFAEGFIWANIWHSPMIVKIDPQSGELVGFYDLNELVQKHSSGSRERVLNGIAYDEEKNAFWVTGKLWPTRYLIKFGEARKPQ